MRFITGDSASASASFFPSPSHCGRLWGGGGLGLRWRRGESGIAMSAPSPASPSCSMARWSGEEAEEEAAAAAAAAAAAVLVGGGGQEEALGVRDGAARVGGGGARRGQAWCAWFVCDVLVGVSGREGVVSMLLGFFSHFLPEEEEEAEAAVAKKAAAAPAEEERGGVVAPDAREASPRPACAVAGEGV